MATLIGLALLCAGAGVYLWPHLIPEKWFGKAENPWILKAGAIIAVALGIAMLAAF